MVVDRVTQLGVSHSKEIRLEVCRSLHIYDRIYFRLSMLLDSPRMRRWVSFHGLLRSETEFRYHLPVVLWIRTLVWQDVYLENSGEVLPKLCLG